MTTMENLIDECGGMGKYQLILIFAIYIHKVNSGWSMLQMAFGSFIPDWYCEVEGSSSVSDTKNNDTATATTTSSFFDFYNNDTFMTCTVNNSLTGYSEETCQSYRFMGPAKTVVSEWDLVCDRQWIKSTITSIQMAGVLVGAMSGGQLSDMFGRKKATFGYSLFHALLNFGAAFSTSWEMFAVFRFFLGVGIGAVLVVVFPYPMEFMPTKWRPLLAVLPDWATGISCFALTALFVENWSYLHIGCGIFSLPPLLGFYHVPESVRWLTLKGRFDEAEKIFEQMARVNGRKPPKNVRDVLERVYQEETKSRTQGKQYTYWDLFKGKRQIKISFIFCYMWFAISIVYYGLSFGVAALAGNLYLNIFLLAVLELPLMFSTFYFNNKIGRKWTCIACLSCVAISSCGCLIVQLSVSDYDSRVQWITALCLIAKMSLGTALNVTRTWVCELHPTVVRSLGFGLCNTVARVGGILSPFAVDLENHPLIAYSLMTGLLTISVFSSMFAPDTKGMLLADSIGQQVVEVEQGDNCENKMALKDADHDDNDNDDVISPMNEMKPINGDGLHTKEV